MIAMITTEEYQELIMAKKRGENDRIVRKKAEEELRNVKAELNCLLRVLTDGKEVIQWNDGKFECYDLADRQVITNYINENYIKNGKLMLKGE